MAPRLTRRPSPRLQKAVLLAFFVRVSFGFFAASSLFEGTGARDAVLLAPGALEAFDFFRVQREQLSSNATTSLVWLLLGQLFVWVAQYGMLRAAIFDEAPRIRAGGHWFSGLVFVATRLLTRAMQVGLLVLLFRLFWSLQSKMETLGLAGVMSCLVSCGLLGATVLWLLSGLFDQLVLGLSGAASGPKLWARIGGPWLLIRSAAALPAITSGLLLLSISGQSAWSLAAGEGWGRALVFVVGGLALLCSVLGQAWWFSRLVRLVPAVTDRVR